MGLRGSKCPLEDMKECKLITHGIQITTLEELCFMSLLGTVIITSRLRKNIKF